MTDGRRVLVTGISGFLGGHVALALLKRGYMVRGSLRDLSRAKKVHTTLQEAGADTARLEFCSLDLLDDAGWADAAEGCQYLQHIASPFVLTMPKDENALIGPAVDGTRRALRAALDAGHERIVLTSSVAAIDGGHRDYRQPLTPGDWTQTDGPRVNAYAKAKTLAEKSAWALVEAEGQRNRLAVINPGTMLGPLLDDDPGTSASVIQRLLKGEMPMIPNLILPYVDVRDVAEAQVAAMTAPEAGGHRHIVTNPCVPMGEIAQMLRDKIPERAATIPKRQLPSFMAAILKRFDASLRDSSTYLGVPRRYDGSSGIALLGHPLIPTDDALLTTARSLMQRHLA